MLETFFLSHKETNKWTQILNKWKKKIEIQF